MLCFTACFKSCYRSPNPHPTFLCTSVLAFCCRFEHSLTLLFAQLLLFPFPAVDSTAQHTRGMIHSCTEDFSASRSRGHLGPQSALSIRPPSHPAPPCLNSVMLLNVNSFFVEARKKVGWDVRNVRGLSPRGLESCLCRRRGGDRNCCAPRLSIGWPGVSLLGSSSGAHRCLH